MSNPWDSLAGQILGTLKDSVSDFVDSTKPEVETFLKEKAVQLARQTWISVQGSEAEKLEAIANLRHLKAQVIMEAASLEIVATAKALGLLSKVFDVVANFLIKYGVTLLAAI
jgi:hypothetical protein